MVLKSQAVGPVNDFLAMKFAQYLNEEVLGRAADAEQFWPWSVEKPIIKVFDVMPRYFPSDREFNDKPLSEQYYFIKFERNMRVSVEDMNKRRNEELRRENRPFWQRAGIHVAHGMNCIRTHCKIRTL